VPLAPYPRQKGKPVNTANDANAVTDPLYLSTFAQSSNLRLIFATKLPQLNEISSKCTILGVEQQAVYGLIFKKRLNEVCADNGLNLLQFSERVEISYRTIQNYIAEISTPKGDFYALLYEVFGVYPNWMLLGIGPKYTPDQSIPEIADNHSDHHTLLSNASDTVSLQALDFDASSGNGSAGPTEEGASHFALNVNWLNRRGLNPDHLTLIAMAGNSMEPDHYDGDLLVVDLSSTDLAESNIYAVRFSGALYVKRIQHQPDGKIFLLSMNRDYPPIELQRPIADQLDVIGRIALTLHTW
jgi:phage repressor protein C with HTH and peptisase S24 domain